MTKRFNFPGKEEATPPNAKRSRKPPEREDYIFYGVSEQLARDFDAFPLKLMPPTMRIDRFKTEVDYDQFMEGVHEAFTREGAHVKLIIQAHGQSVRTEAAPTSAGSGSHEVDIAMPGTINIYGTTTIHPSEIFFRFNTNGRPLFVDFYGCNIGEKLKDEEDLARNYEEMPNNTSLIINAGQFISLVSMIYGETSATCLEKDPVKAFLKKIAYSADTKKFCCKHEDEFFYFKSSAPKPEKPEDLSPAAIKEFLRGEAARFLEFYHEEVDGSVNVDLLQAEFDTILTPATLSAYKGNAFLIEVVRGKTDYVAHYLSSADEPERKKFLKSGISAAHLVRNPVKSLQMAKLLLENGASFEDLPATKVSAYLGTAIAAQDLEAVQLFFRPEAGIPLAGRVATAKLFLGVGVNPEIDLFLVKLLAEAGAELADADFSALQKATYLASAIEAGDKSLVEFLHNQGALPTTEIGFDAEKSTTITPLIIAEKQPDSEIKTEILEILRKPRNPAPDVIVAGGEKLVSGPTSHEHNL